MTGTARMFLGLVGGAAAGLVLARIAPGAAATAVAVAEPLGTLWLHALQMTVVPLIVSLLVVGVAQAADIAATGRIARRSLAWILALSTAAAALSAVITPRFLAAMPRSAALTAALDNATAGAPAAAQPTAAGRLTALVPTNVVAAAASGAVAPLVVFTLCFALALATLEPARRDPVVGLAQTVADAMTRIVGWVLRAGPIGVAALILPVTVRAGGAVLGALGIYVLLLVTVYLVITALLYGLARLGRGEPLATFAAAILPAQAVAAGTQSSLASLPAMLEATRRLGYPAAACGLVLPLAVSLFRVTSPAQYVAVAGFLAWAQGGELAPGAVAVAILMSVVISLGSVGLPGQASFMGTVLPVVQAAGLPVEPLGLLLAVDLVPDVFATVGNVTGDLALTSRIARAELPPMMKVRRS
jgi:proton glutamate symport protein